MPGYKWMDGMGLEFEWYLDGVRYRAAYAAKNKIATAKFLYFRFNDFILEKGDKSN